MTKSEFFRKLLFLSLLSLLVFTPCKGQLVLEKKHKKVTIPKNAEIGITTKEKTYIYNHPEYWKLDSVYPDYLTIRNVKLSEKVTVTDPDYNNPDRDDWVLLEVTGDGTPSHPKKYTFKKPVMYNIVEIPYSNIVEIKYKERQIEGGSCMGVVVPPLLIVLSPFTGFENGVYYVERFLLTLAAGVAGTLAIYLYLRPYRVRTYKMGSWVVGT